MTVCLHVRVYACMYVCPYACLCQTVPSLYVCVCGPASIPACLTYACMCVCVYLYVCRCVYVCMPACAFVCMCNSAYVCTISHTKFVGGQILKGVAMPMRRAHLGCRRMALGAHA